MGLFMDNMYSHAHTPRIRCPNGADRLADFRALILKYGWNSYHKNLLWANLGPRLIFSLKDPYSRRERD